MKNEASRHILGISKSKLFPLFRTVKKWILTGLRILGKIVIRLIALALLAAVFVIPFLSNKLGPSLAQWIWYPSYAVFLILVALDWHLHKQPTFKSPVVEFYYNTSLALLNNNRAQNIAVHII